MLVVLTILGCVVGSLAQGFLPKLGKLSEIGADLGGKVGSGIGEGIGSALDTGLKVPGGLLGIASNLPSLGGAKVPAGRPDKARPGYNTNDGYSSGGNYGSKGYEGGSSSSGRQGYETQGSGGAYENGGRYDRERMVSERERGERFEAGRGGQGSARGAAEGRSDNYERGAANYGEGYENAYNAGRALL